MPRRCTGVILALMAVALAACLDEDLLQDLPGRAAMTHDGGVRDAPGAGGGAGCPGLAGVVTGAVVESGICESAPLRAHQGEIRWDSTHMQCYSAVKVATGWKLTQVEESWLAPDPALPVSAGLQRVQRCFDARETQRLCRLNAGIIDPCLRHTSCIHQMEIGCARLRPPAVLDAEARGEPLFPAAASVCTAATVGRLGFSAELTRRQKIGSCLGSNALNTQIVTCTFLGQSLRVDRGFCERLTTCVAPALRQRYPAAVGTVNTLTFPSGQRTLMVDLSCGQGAALTSNHHPNRGCRAIDINVHQNYGNLRRNWVPVTEMPPEFVAVMEECGMIWGGRFNGTMERAEIGCDPMHFDYAPACLE